MASIEDQEHNYVETILKTSQEGAELYNLCAHLQPHPKELFDEFMLIKIDLENELNPHFTNCDVQVFGSATTGLAFKDCDFDFYVSGDLISHMDYSKTTDNIILLKLTTIKRVLNKSRKFIKLISIFKAKIPIIKIVHKSTNRQCDINVSNNSGVLNSIFIYNLLKFDYRIHPLAVIIKYWTKQNELSCASKFTNYAIFWLLVHFLQIISDPILPRIHDLHINNEPFSFEGFNLVYDKTKLIKTNNIKSVGELLKEFMNYYSGFNFTNTVISLYHGKVFDRIEYQKLESHNIIDISSINWNCPVIVFDPFERQRNICGSIHTSTLYLFKQLACNSVEILKKYDQPSSKLLQLLFIKVKIPKRKFAVSQGKLVEIVLRPLNDEMKTIRCILSKKYEGQLISIDQIQQYWKENVIIYTQLIIKEIYGGKVILLEHVNDVKNDTKRIVLNATISMEKNIWNNRKRSDQNSCKNILSIEENTTKLLLESESTKTIVLNMNLQIENFNAEPILILKFAESSASKDSSFKSFFTSFSSNLRFYLILYLRSVLS